MRFIGVHALMPTTLGLSIELPSELKTDYMPLSFEEGGIGFVLKDAPCELGNSMKFRFDSISTGAVDWIAGKASVKIWPEGEKTYDMFLSMLQDYIDHPENYTREEVEKYTLYTMPENLLRYLYFGIECKQHGLDTSCAADVISNPDAYRDTLSRLFPMQNFTVKIYSSSGELAAEENLSYDFISCNHYYSVGEKLDHNPISLYDLEPDVYTVVIEES